MPTVITLPPIAFDTLAVAAAATITATTDRIYVRGHTTLNDGGAYTWVRVGSSEPSHGCKEQFADGDWWVPENVGCLRPEVIGGFPSTTVSAGAEINAIYDYLGVGGAVILGAPFATDETIDITRNGQQLLGTAYAASVFNANTTIGSLIKWIGAAGGTVVHVRSTDLSTSATTQISSVKIDGIQIDCNELAARGLDVQSSDMIEIPRLKVHNPRHDTNGQIAVIFRSHNGVDDSFINCNYRPHIGQLIIWCQGQAHGLWLTGKHGSNGSNVTFMGLSQTHITHETGHACYIDKADDIKFEGYATSRRTGGTGKSLSIDTTVSGAFVVGLAFEQFHAGAADGVPDVYISGDEIRQNVIENLSGVDDSPTFTFVNDAIEGESLTIRHYMGTGYSGDYKTEKPFTELPYHIKHIGGKPVLFLGLGQSDNAMYRTLSGTNTVVAPVDVPPNVKVWNNLVTNSHDSTDTTLATGTAFVAPPSDRFTSPMGKAYARARKEPFRQFYVMNLAYSGAPISYWLSGGAVDLHTPMDANIVAALAALDLTIDEVEVVFDWDQGNSDVSNASYETNFEDMLTRWAGEGWYKPECSLLVINSIANSAVSGVAANDGMNVRLRKLAQRAPHNRRFFDNTWLASGYWDANQHARHGYEFIAEAYEEQRGPLVPLVSYLPVLTPILFIGGVTATTSYTRQHCAWRFDHQSRVFRLTVDMILSGSLPSETGGLAVAFTGGLSAWLRATDNTGGGVSRYAVAMDARNFATPINDVIVSMLAGDSFLTVLKRTTSGGTTDTYTQMTHADLATGATFRFEIDWIVAA